MYHSAGAASTRALKRRLHKDAKQAERERVGLACGELGVVRACSTAGDHELGKPIPACRELDVMEAPLFDLEVRGVPALQYFGSRVWNTVGQEKR